MNIAASLALTSFFVIYLAVAEAAPEAAQSPKMEQREVRSPEATFKQTGADVSNKQGGGLVSAVSGKFFDPAIQTHLSTELIWTENHVVSSFIGADGPDNVQGTFGWAKNSIINLFDANYKGTQVKFNFTVTDQKEILFSVNGHKIDLKKAVDSE